MCRRELRAVNKIKQLLVAILTTYSLGSFSATVWKQSDGTYHLYKESKVNRYVLSTNLEVGSSWVRQEGTYIQCVSTGGSKKYWPTGKDCYGKDVVVVQKSCEAFVCNDDFGWTFDLTKNTTLVCPMVKIEKGVAQIYEGLQAGQTRCR